MLYIVYNNAIVTVHTQTCFILADFRSPPLLLAGLNSTAYIFSGWIFFFIGYLRNVSFLAGFIFHSYRSFFLLAEASDLARLLLDLAN